MTADAGDVGGVTLEGTNQKNGSPTAAAAPEEIAQSVEESMKRTEEAEIKLEASATLEDRITLLASLVGEREAAAAAVVTGGARARAGSNVAPAAPVRLSHLLRELEEILLLSKWDEVESSSLVQLRKLCLHLLTSPTGDRTLRRSYAVDTLAAAVLKAT
ncbi:26S proteasome non-ATPase regulatory subunit 7, partial [Perkinsus olseni]